MSSRHLDEAVLHAFVACELDDTAAAQVAEHLDGCPACATQAATLDPLAAAFASVDDPVVPADLAQAVLERAQLPTRFGPEPAIAAALLGVAIVVLVLTGSPSQLLSTVATLLSTASTVTGALWLFPAAPTPLWLAAGALVLVTGALTTRQLELRRTA